MGVCIECNRNLIGDFATCYDGSFICEGCIWDEVRQRFSGSGVAINSSLYNAIKTTYEGYKCLEVPVTVKEIFEFINIAEEDVFRKNYDYNIFEGADDGGYLEILAKEIEEFKLDITVREYLKWIISNSTDAELEYHGWDTLILSQDEIIKYRLEHKLPGCKAL